MNRKELFYFSGSDLMIRVDIDQINNRATYATHRVLNRGEKVLVESYIEKEIFSSPVSNIRYIGEDAKLATEYTKFQNTQDKKKIEDAFEKLRKKDKEITELVHTTIDGANKEFCFNRIGNILRDRNENHPEDPEYRLSELEQTILEYNSFVGKDQRVDINSLIKEQV